MRADVLVARPALQAPRTATMATVAFVVGAFLVGWTAYIHFDLWHSIGYRHIHIIGPLFVVQAVAGLVLGILLLLVRRVWVAIGGIGFVLSTVGGFLLSVLLPKGLFNFKESWLAPFAKQAFVIEVAAAVVLLIAAALCLAPRGRSAS
jgi:hypothetical protein